MSYTGRKIFDRAISIIDDLGENGVVNEADSKDYMDRAPYLLDMFQKEVAKSGDLYKTFEISCTRRKNLLGDLNQYGIIKENNGTPDLYSAVGANCFYLETDGSCIVTFTENGVPLSGKYSFNGGVETDFDGTISITVPEGTTSFLPVKGILSVNSQTSTVAMTISGTYYFRHNNRALCPYKYPSALKVPDFKSWYKITMPADFKSRTQVIDEFPSWQYESSGNHKWEGNNELYVLFSYEGIIRIKYVPVPVEITSLDQTLEIDDIVAQSGAYYLAEHFAMADQNSELAAMCKSKYKELKAESMIKTALSPTEIIDVYGLNT